MVALRKIGAPNAASKQYIADKAAPDVRRVKHHMARRVARAVAHLHRGLP